MPPLLPKPQAGACWDSRKKRISLRTCYEKFLGRTDVDILIPYSHGKLQICRCRWGGTSFSPGQYLGLPPFQETCVNFLTIHSFSGWWLSHPTEKSAKVIGDHHAMTLCLEIQRNETTNQIIIGYIPSGNQTWFAGKSFIYSWFSIKPSI